MTLPAEAPPELLAGPYVAPVCRRGDWLPDERFGLVEVGGWSAGRIPWPRQKKAGRPSLILTGDLAAAVAVESVEAIAHWWGVGVVTVWAWRKALGVGRVTDGTRQLLQERTGVPPEAAARGRARARAPEAIAKMAETKRGRPAPPQTRAGLLRAAKASKPEGWGDRANAWMTEAKIATGQQTGVRFLASPDPAGGYTARAVGPAIHTQADTIEDLRRAAEEAVRCHFGRDIPVLIDLTPAETPPLPAPGDNEPPQRA